ncbi:MAG: bifunctional 5,10-methylenetetrahydrofolate dehydrogenase/5,10-methenyltetrahydrofolate cyclohydrolase [Thermoplasmata archaeon]|nr:bifunctional 5,10-methylenetetrahydrofolate dehydrogenase/5,10-methenyltetrahydrofolate cyclohydrolase [Thermoplasmata archaeon]
MRIECKSLAKNIREQAKREAKGKKLYLHNIVVGEDEASLVYAKSNLKLLRKMGFDGKIHHLEEDEKILLGLIDSLNEDERVHGIMVNFPLPKNIDAMKVRERILPIKDVDGINPLNYGKLLLGQEILVPNTPRAVIRILETITNLGGKDVLIINRTPVVGKPLSLLLLNRDATPTIAHSKTMNLEEKARNADIIVVAVGKPGFLREDMVKEGAIVIDVGINVVDGKIVGDADFENIEKKAYITPVPGGVGTVTNACLIENLVKAAKLQGVI